MFGLIDWFRRRRAAREAFRNEWRTHLQADVPFYAELAPEDRARFEDKLKVLILTKHFEGAGGFAVDERARVVVAAAAARLVMNMPRQHYQRLSDIVIYPGDYRHPGSDPDQVIFGEAHHHGTVVLSWEAVLGGLKNPGDGHDTASHEFAHVLDAADGRFDGTPVLKQFAAYAPWARVMTGEFVRLRGKKRHVLRRYGATNEAEFFAVATEAFFEKPGQLERKHPDLFRALQDYYSGSSD
jgi:Mlc titration factor MtfA (ptsG expression regulator)